MVNLKTEKYMGEKYMAIMTQIPIGSKLKVLKTGKIVTLEEIRNFPTRYRTKNESSKIEYYKTFEVEVVETTKKTE